MTFELGLQHRGIADLKKLLRHADTQGIQVIHAPAPLGGVVTEPIADLDIAALTTAADPIAHRRGAQPDTG